MNHPVNKAERLRQKFKHEQKKAPVKGPSKRAIKEELKERDATKAVEEALNQLQ